MTAQPKTLFLLNLGLLALLVFGVYLTFALFEIWAFFPFWVKNVTLLGSLTLVYLYARQGLKNIESHSPKINPALGFGAGFAAILVVLGIVQAGPALPGRLVQALTFSLSQPPKEVLLSLNVAPPTHTNLPEANLISFEDGPVSRLTLNDPGPFPEGSIIKIEIAMEETSNPVISLGKDWARPQPLGENKFSVRQVLKEASVLSIQVGPYVAITQNFSVSPDKDPSIRFAEDPALTARDSVKLEAAFEDDFGVEEIYLEVTGGGIDPALFRLPFVPGEANRAEGAFFINLLDDPRAGARVTGKLIAVDALGQRAESGTLLFDLPEKKFRVPLAQEVADIRKALLLNSERHRAQIGRIEELTENPARFEGQRGVYLALRSTYWRLRSAETQKDIDEVARFLWQSALTLEDDGSFEEQSLRMLLEAMTGQALTATDVRGFERDAATLGAKADELFRREFRQTRRRFSFNAGVDGFEIPQVGQFRDLMKVLEREATENNRENVIRVLLEARALYEDLGALKGRLTRPGT